MVLIIKKEKRRFPNTKGNRLPFTKNVCQKITKDKPLLVTDLNIDIVFKVVLAGFMKIGELTYTVAKAKKATFAEINLTRSDISFTQNNQYAILRLKKSKTDKKHIGVQIILIVLGD